MNQPSQKIVNEFNKLNHQNLTLNWCEKRKAWGAMEYDFYKGSSWFCFFTIDRKRK